MTIIEALKISRIVRRKSTVYVLPHWQQDNWLSFEPGEISFLDYESVMANDWEVQEQCRMISKNDIKEAARRYLGAPLAETAFVDGIIKELGL